MSDTEAKLDFTADPKVAERAIDSLTKKMAGLEEQNRKLNENAKKGAHESKQALDAWAEGMKGLDDAGRKAMAHSDETWKRGLDTLKKQNEALHEGHHWLTEQGQELLKLGVGFLTVEKGVEKVVEVYDEWREHVKELGKEHEELAKRVVKTLHQSGLLKFGPEMEEFIEKGAGNTATPEQVRQAISGVATGAPMADVETQKALVKETVKGAPLGIDLAERGLLVGKLSKIAPEKSAGDLADIASYMEHQAGSRAGELGSPNFLRSIRALKTAGIGTDEALSIGMQALEDDQQMRKFSQLGELLDESNKFAPHGKHHRLSPEERLKQQFGQMSAAERFQTLSAGGDMAQAVSGGMAFSLKMMPEAQRQQLLAELGEAQSGDYYNQEIQSLGKFGMGRKALVAQETAVAKAEQESALGGPRSVLTNLQEQRKARARNLISSVGNYLEGAGEEFFFNTTAAATGQEDYVRRAVQRGQAIGDITAEQAEKLIAALDRNTEATRRNTANNGQARPNVNANGEQGNP